MIALSTGYWFVLRPPDDAAPEPGEVAVLEPIQINLEGGQYLRLSIGLQATVDVSEELDGSKALDAAIGMFSGRSAEDLADPETRDSLKASLRAEVAELYEGEVIDLYFTEFVTQ